jgi:hypothetical protein
MVATEAHVAVPFTTPGMEVFDAFRVYCVVGGVVVTLGMIVQFLALQPGISARLQRARATFILGTTLLLAADIDVEFERFGLPPMPFRLFAITAGVTVLLLWLVFEQCARRHDPADRLRRINEPGGL